MINIDEYEEKVITYSDKNYYSITETVLTKKKGYKVLDKVFDTFNYAFTKVNFDTGLVGYIDKDKQDCPIHIKHPNGIEVKGVNIFFENDNN